MKRWAWIVTLSAVGLVNLPAIAANPDAQDSVVVGQALKQLEIPGKISAVLWTRRKDEFTLQVVRDIAEERGRKQVTSRSVPPMSTTSAAEGLQAWLLMADGAAIPPSRRLEATEKERARCAESPRTRCLGYEVLFSYPHADGEKAVAVALSIGDVFLIENLESL